MMIEETVSASELVLGAETSFNTDTALDSFLNQQVWASRRTYEDKEDIEFIAKEAYNIAIYDALLLLKADKTVSDHAVIERIENLVVDR